MTERHYPIPPQPDDDPRFSFGLIWDVARLLEQHGYPPIDGDDFVDLRQALYRFLYTDRDGGAS
ncbi:hypothetical protein [Streptomyces phytophilus]|uniref:hypothetical protein n=1 Tax=Streptomyces phytophilus TaxID=722715 RepID=UPI0015F0058E|nr:hypothetical protein [Streptomyces phytophilus]